ncbi:MAG: DUF4261 domain-containing protein [Actinomycetota bacterium]
MPGPSFFLLIPGPWTEEGDCFSALTDAGLRPSSFADFDLTTEGSIGVMAVTDPDGFRLRPGQITDDDLDACAASTTAVVLEVPGTLDTQRNMVHRASTALRAAGGIAIRCEASGLATSWPAWLDALDSTDPTAVLSVAVDFGFDGDRYYSNGMHQFGLPDTEARDLTPDEAAEWLQGLCGYLLVEHPELVTGQTFAPQIGADIRVLERWPDLRFNVNDGCHNPYGVWRGLAAGVAGLAPLNPQPTPVPALIDLLAAKERELGRALDPVEVASVAEQMTCVVMRPHDVQALEHGRGYADIEPRRAWEQWQAIRRNR